MVTVIVKVHVYCWKYHSCINWHNIFRVYIRIHVEMRINNELIKVLASDWILRIVLWPIDVKYLLNSLPTVMSSLL